MNSEIKVIIFDLGRTILYPLEPWSEKFTSAYTALLDVLVNSGFCGSDSTTPQQIQAYFDEYYVQRNIDQIELTAEFVLKRFLRTKRCKKIPENIIREALDAMYCVTQLNWTIENDAVPTLIELSRKGYHLGLISNAADDLDVQQLIDRWDIRKYFKFILTSAKSGWRKPHPQIFQKALDFFSITSSEALMVGDTLSADIAGANNLGIYSVWITRRAQMPPDGELNNQPHAIISCLEELPLLLKELKEDSN